MVAGIISKSKRFNRSEAPDESGNYNRVKRDSEQGLRHTEYAYYFAPDESGNYKLLVLVT